MLIVYTRISRMSIWHPKSLHQIYKYKSWTSRKSCPIFCIQLAKSDHLGGVLGCIFVCELFCIDFICIHGLLPPSFDGSMIPTKNEQRNNTDGSLCWVQELCKFRVVPLSIPHWIVLLKSAPTSLFPPSFDLCKLIRLTDSLKQLLVQLCGTVENKMSCPPSRDV